MNSIFTLSVIDEVTEVSTIDKRDSSQLEQATVDIPYNNFQPDNYLGLSADPGRTSIFSSETSYGEILPPGQLTLKTGERSSLYAKSLPSIPGSKSPSIRSQAVSAAGSRKSHSPRNSIARSDNQIVEEIVSKPAIAFPEPQLASPARSAVRSQHSAKPSSPRKSVKSEGSFFSSSSSSSSSSLSSSLSSHTIRPEPKVTQEYSQEPKGPSYRFSGQSSPPTYRSISSGNKGSPVQPVGLLSPSARSRSISSSSSSSSLSSRSTSSVSTERPAYTERLANSSQLVLRSARQDVSQGPLRTMDDVMDEVASSLALRAKMQAETVTLAPDEQVKIGVCSTMSKSDDRRFMEVLAEKVHHAMTLHASYLFALFPSVNASSDKVTLVICGAPQLLVTKAAILAGLRFKTRLAEVMDDEGTWIGALAPRPGSAGWANSGYDEELLWDILRKAITPSNPTKPPPDSRGVEELVAKAREKLDRLNPREAFQESLDEGILVDIRSESQRLTHGTIPGAIFIERNDLEWCFDPRSTDTRLPIADRYDLRVIIYCQTGERSSLAADALQRIGLWRTTDIIGGFTRWKEEGLPTESPFDEQSEVRSSLTTPRFKTSLI